MSEDRDPQGRFAEPAFGREGTERDCGYKPMFERKDDAGDLTVREAAKLRAQENPRKDDETIREIYTDAEGNPAPANETLTIERAADDMRESRRARAEAAAEEADAALLKELGVKIEPKKAASEAETDEDQPEPAAVKPSPKDGELDPDLEAALNNPQAREALQAQVAENESARQQYRNAIDAAVQIAQASFVAQFPEFANAPADQHAQIATAIAQQNPGRWAQIQNIVANTSRLFDAQRVESQLASERQAAEFKTFAVEQDGLFDRAAQGISPEVQQRATAEVISGLKEYGIKPAEFLKMFATDRTLRSAPFQRMMLEAGLYRSMMKAKKAVVTQRVPPVQRPGVSVPRGHSASTKLATLTTQFNQNPTLRNAAALQAAQRAARANQS